MIYFPEDAGLVLDTELLEVGVCLQEEDILLDHRLHQLANIWQ